MKLDVLIIGAGQAGLAMGYFLSKTKLSYQILESSGAIGDSWRNRYDSLKLFTPRSYSALPGMPFPGDLDVYPTKDEVADYLSNYVRKFELHIKCNTYVEKLEQTLEGFLVHTAKESYSAKQVVIATGPFQKPFIPSYKGALSSEIIQLHSSEYKNSSQIPQGKVLVIGGGNSGAQIAVDLAQTHKVLFSTRKKLTFRPYNILGKSLFWWIDKLGILTAPTDSWIAQKVKAMGDPIIGLELKQLLEKGLIKHVPGIRQFESKNVEFTDGSQETIDTIIWSTGYVSDYRLINIPEALDSHGNPIHTKGVSNIKGLYYVGLPWQSSRASALLYGVGKDAEYISQEMVKF